MRNERRQFLMELLVELMAGIGDLIYYLAIGCGVIAIFYYLGQGCGNG